MREGFTKYETARILGARALQIAMDAPILVKINKEELEKINYNPLKIAEIELDSDALPITVKRPLPKKIEEKLPEKKGKKEEINKEKADAKSVAEARKVEAEIMEEGEIMELVKSDEEAEEEPEEEEGI